MTALHHFDNGCLLMFRSTQQNDYYVLIRISIEYYVKIVVIMLLRSSSLQPL